MFVAFRSTRPCVRTVCPRARMSQQLAREKRMVERNDVKQLRLQENTQRNAVGLGDSDL